MGVLPLLITRTARGSGRIPRTTPWKRREPRADGARGSRLVVCQRNVWQTSRPGWSNQKKYTMLRTGSA
ncbi:hypothetical protein GCM10009527_043940 [Actinomadura nitritigenes]